ncbi:MAG: hypothetical protein L0H84_24600 [Pseudonocardia sp.]|nr:hypothetical protein [Pseudonocardia sp.]
MRRSITSQSIPAPATSAAATAARDELERHIRAHKARQATALDDVARKGEGRAVRAWRAAMRDHLAANPDLRRLSYREQVGAGNLPDTALRARVGPNGDPLGPKPPNQLTVDELDNAMAAAIAAEDLDLIGVLGDEMDRRDAERHAREARNARARGRRAAQADRRAEAQAAHLEELVNAGVGDEEATERAYGITRERQRRNEARARLVGNGYGYLGSFDKMARAAYKDALEEEWFRAENEAGELLSRKAQARGISDRALFLRNEAFARKWASDELKQWWDINGRLTYAQFVDGLVNGGARGTYRGGDFLQ